MRLEIDTIKDSPEDIRKAITLLQALLSSPHQTTPHKNIFETGAAPTMGTLFDPPKQQTSPYSLFDDEKEKKQILEYY